MKIPKVFFAIPLSLMLIACDGSPENASPVSYKSGMPYQSVMESDVAKVRAYFEAMGSEEVSIDLKSADLTVEEKLITAWTLKSIGEWSPGDPGFVELRFKKVKGGDEYAYVIDLHKRKGSIALIDDKDYIHLFAALLVSDPEWHGLIDAEGPSLISFFGEGA